MFQFTFGQPPCARLMARVFALMFSVAVALGGSGCPDDPAPQTPDCPDCVEGSLKVADPAARACEALIEVTATTGAPSTATVTFAAGVTGRALTEGDRTGIAFIAAAGQPFPQAAATIEAPGQLTLLSSQCSDADGQPIGGDALTL